MSKYNPHHVERIDFNFKLPAMTPPTPPPYPITDACRPVFPLADFYKHYQVFHDGRIWSRRGFRYLKTHHSKSGYVCVSLDLPGIKSYRLHRIVAICCIPNPENKPEVNHKDGNKDNNSVQNLEWVTRKENCDHARDVLGRSGQFEPGNNRKICRFSVDDIRAIRGRAATGEMHKSIAAHYKANRKHITQIVNKTIWRNVT